ncbi:methyltransferase domain-containing protein [Acholeplasma vituli]|uniref:Methyltransferase domain-containing protein n=1 Tax=Paracholeplasma vituli TaxID=69473 RepID=A0ABT2Q082_9MOLU|nr:methyltransferase domain-containing protein [Paracholeplasma vituli]MCU0105382.1 methyltransferase domain-containing protein [Paracholeplasma vituli]
MTNLTKINELKLKAQSLKVPILSDDGLLFLIKTLNENNVKSVLEIGSAVGYSAIALALHTGAKVTTIEREEDLVQMAKKHIQENNLEDTITLIHADALDVELDKNLKFDAIFIDAAKAQYEKFFNKYEPYLSDFGIIITDNLNFHNVDIETVSRGTRNLVKRLEAFKTFLQTHPTYESELFDIGDGMSISKRIKP